MKVLAIASVLFAAISASHDSRMNATEITESLSASLEQFLKASYLDVRVRSAVKGSLGLLPPSLGKKLSAMDRDFVSYLSPKIEETVSVSVRSVLKTVGSFKGLPGGISQEEMTQLLTQQGISTARHVFPQLEKNLPTWSEDVANLVNSDPAAQKVAQATNLETMPLERRSNVNRSRRAPIKKIITAAVVTAAILKWGPTIVENILISIFFAIFGPIFEKNFGITLE